MFPDLMDSQNIRIAIDNAVDYMVINWGDTLEALASPLLQFLNIIERGLLTTPWWLIIFVLGALAYLSSRKWTLSAGVMAMMFLLGLLDLWEDTMKTMALMLAATLTSIVIGMPIGILASHSKSLRSIILPVLDVMQTMPSFVYLIPGVMLFGPGKIPAILATIIYAVPPLIRLTDLGIRLVDKQVIEAVEAFGASDRQILLGVRIPLAMPTIMAGINQTTMMALAMVVIASMIGAGGLGYQVLQGIGRLEVSRGLLAGLGIVALAIIFDRITQAYGRRLQQHLHLEDK